MDLLSTIKYQIHGYVIPLGYKIYVHNLKEASIAKKLRMEEASSSSFVIPQEISKKYFTTLVMLVN